MLSAGNLNALEDAGFSFIAGSRISKAPYDLVEHFALGTALYDGGTRESKRVMGVGVNGWERQVSTTTPRNATDETTTPLTSKSKAPRKSSMAAFRSRRTGS